MATDAEREVSRRGTDGLPDDLSRQIALMASRAPSYRRLLTQTLHLLGDPVHGGSVLASFQRAWSKREFRAFYERPLLLLAALRSEALADGPSHPIHAALRDRSPEVDAVTEAAVRSALDASRTGLWTALALRRVQTNDTSRGLAWLWPAEIAGASDRMRPVVLVDVGCSAGLNLIADALPNIWTTATGQPLKVARVPKVVGRFGLDERPIELARAEEARWLQACVWPGEADRLERLDLAMAAFRAARDRGDRLEVTKRNAIGAAAFVRSLKSSIPGDALVIVYQTMMAGYLDAPTLAAFEGGLHDLVVSSPPGSVLWVDLEVKGPAASRRPAELCVHARSGKERVDLLIGTTGYHPTEVAVREDAVRELRDLMRAGR